MIDAYPLTWPVHWSRTHTPQRSPFTTTIAGARSGVLRELELLGARDIVISSNAELLGVLIYGRNPVAINGTATT